jgi:hypothetical protein
MRSTDNCPTPTNSTASRFEPPYFVLLTTRIPHPHVQVPDDMDDDLFEIAAGLPLRDKKRDKEQQPAEEEPPPNEEQIELDFCIF